MAVLSLFSSKMWSFKLVAIFISVIISVSGIGLKKFATVPGSGNHVIGSETSNTKVTVPASDSAERSKEEKKSRNLCVWLNIPANATAESLAVDGSRAKFLAELEVGIYTAFALETEQLHGSHSGGKALIQIPTSLNQEKTKNLNRCPISDPSGRKTTVSVNMKISKGTNADTLIANLRRSPMLANTFREYVAKRIGQLRRSGEEVQSESMQTHDYLNLEHVIGKTMLDTTGKTDVEKQKKSKKGEQSGTEKDLEKKDGAVEVEEMESRYNSWSSASSDWSWTSADGWTHTPKDTGYRTQTSSVDNYYSVDNYCWIKGIGSLKKKGSCNTACHHDADGYACSKDCDDGNLESCKAACENHDYSTKCDKACQDGYYFDSCAKACKTGYYSESCTTLANRCSTIESVADRASWCNKACVDGGDVGSCSTACRDSGDDSSESCKILKDRCSNPNTSDRASWCSAACNDAGDSASCKESCQMYGDETSCSKACGKYGDARFCRILKDRCLYQHTSNRASWCSAACNGGGDSPSCRKSCQIGDETSCSKSCVIYGDKPSCAKSCQTYGDETSCSKACVIYGDKPSCAKSCRMWYGDETSCSKACGNGDARSCQILKDRCLYQDRSNRASWCSAACNHGDHAESCATSCKMYGHEPSCSKACRDYEDAPSCQILKDRCYNHWQYKDGHASWCSAACHDGDHADSCVTSCEKYKSETSCSKACAAHKRETSCTTLADHCSALSQSDRASWCSAACNDAGHVGSCATSCVMYGHETSCSKACAVHNRETSCTTLADRCSHLSDREAWCARACNDAGHVGSCGWGCHFGDNPSCRKVCLERGESDFKVCRKGVTLVNWPDPLANWPEPPSKEERDRNACKNQSDASSCKQSCGADGDIGSCYHLCFHETSYQPTFSRPDAGFGCHQVCQRVGNILGACEKACAANIGQSRYLSSCVKACDPEIADRVDPPSYLTTHLDIATDTVEAALDCEKPPPPDDADWSAHTGFCWSRGQRMQSLCLGFCGDGMGNRRDGMYNQNLDKNLIVSHNPSDNHPSKNCYHACTDRVFIPHEHRDCAETDNKKYDNNKYRTYNRANFLAMMDMKAYVCKAVCVVAGDGSSCRKESEWSPCKEARNFVAPDGDGLLHYANYPGVSCIDESQGTDEEPAIPGPAIPEIRPIPESDEADSSQENGGVHDRYEELKCQPSAIDELWHERNEKLSLSL